MSVSRQRKEQLKDNLEQLTQCEHEQIFKLIRDITQHFTCSESGVFVSADVIPDECFSKIEEYIAFCFEQKKHLKAGEVKREEYTRMLKPQNG
jgi:hypothetical protein